MKKTILLLLLVAISFSICACGTSNQTEVPSEKEVLYDKYEDIITLLENEDYDGALSAITAKKPEPERVTVLINADNLYDYYYVEPAEDIIDRDASGKAMKIWPFGWVRNYFLKDEILPKVDIEETFVEIGYTCDYVLKKLSIDWNTGTYSFSDETYDDYFNEIIADGMAEAHSSVLSKQSGPTATIELHPAQYVWYKTEYGQWSQDIMDDENVEYYMFVETNPQIVRCTGQVVILK